MRRRLTVAALAVATIALSSAVGPTTKKDDLVILSAALLISFVGGVVAGMLLVAHQRRAEIKQLQQQARAYRLQAVALKDLCQRLERVNQLAAASKPSLISRRARTVYPSWARRA